MLGEKEEIARIKNSLRAGRTREEVTNSLMARGYKYDYISVLLKKATRGRKFLFGSLVFVVILGLLSWAVYGTFFLTKDIQVNLTNPLAGVKVLNKEAENTQPDLDNYTEEIEIEDVEVTSEFIDYLLGLIEAQNYLHKIPLSSNVPVINFRTEDKEFYSIVDRDIETSEGLSSEADLEFVIPHDVVVLTTVADDPRQEFLNAVNSGEVQIKMLAGETELFAKGYLGFYDSLTSE